MKEICTKVIYYAIIAGLLIFGATREWKSGNQIIGIFTFIAGLIMLWQVVSNANDLRQNQQSGKIQGNLI